MEQQFLEKFKNYCKKHNMFHPGDKVIVGCSGGPDSIALLTLIWKIKDIYNISILATHVNYHLRGEDSNSDQKYVTDFCYKRNISLIIKNVELNAKDSGVEAKARLLRMEHFEKLLKLYNADSIALGHNKNDQTETILFRLFRGAAFTGLRGILPKNNKIIHPLLEFSRSEIIKFLKSENIYWCEDLSNNEIKYSRNKLRNIYIPKLKEDFNPNLDDQIFKLSKIFFEADEFFKQAISNLFKKEFSYYRIKKVLKFKVDKIIRLNSLLKFYLYRRCVELLTGSSNDFYTSNMNEINKILSFEGSKEIMLPNNILAQKKYGSLFFIVNNNNIDRKNLSVNIRKNVKKATFDDYLIQFKIFNKKPKDLMSEPNSAYFDYNKISFPVKIRYKRNGDKFIPFGMNHYKKLKDFFIDEKVSKFDRDKIMIFEDSEKIFWIAGFRIDNRVAVSKETDKVLKISFEKEIKRKYRKARIKKKVRIK